MNCVKYESIKVFWDMVPCKDWCKTVYLYINPFYINITWKDIFFPMRHIGWSTADLPWGYLPTEAIHLCSWFKISRCNWSKVCNYSRESLVYLACITCHVTDFFLCGGILLWVDICMFCFSVFQLWLGSLYI